MPLVISPGDPGHISHHEEIHAFLDPVDSPFVLAQSGSGTLAGRPAAGVEGRFYLATDNDTLYRDSGSAWEPVHDMLETWEASLLTGSPNLTKLKVPAVIATKSVGQTIAHATSTVVTFPTEDFDNDGMHDLAVNTGRLTAQRAGIYGFSGTLGWDDGTGSQAKYMAIRQNGTSVLAADRPEWSNNLFPAHSITTIANMAVNDFVEIIAFPTANPAASWDVLNGRFVGWFISST